MKLTAADLQELKASLPLMPQKDQEEILELLEAYEQVTGSDAARKELLAFCCAMQPDYKIGAHHKRLAGLLEDVEQRKKDRITVSVAPRHGKSQLCSIYFIAWYLGRNPTHKVMLVSHTTDLATDMGRKVRNVIASAEYQRVFPGVALAADSKSAGRWNTNKGGEFVAAGVGSSIAGRGAHLLIIDDPHSEQDILAGNFDAFESAYEWFTFGARTRLMPGGAVAVIATRWHPADLIGRLQKDMRNPEADQYEVFEFPAVLESKDADGNVIEKALWPEFFDMKALMRTKASMPTFQWNAQYMQNPTGEEGAIVKREWWKQWTAEDPPDCEYIIMTLDAAAEAHNRADYTALTTWGVWFNDEANAHNIILLNSIKERIEFPELKKLAVEEYREWQPDAFIVEKKSNGVPLYQELRRTGVIVQEYTPSRGSMKDPNTKTARLNAVADIVKSGIVWVPQTRWAEELVEEVASFPMGTNDDLCFAAGTMILLADGTTRRIEEMKVGDFVATPVGPKRVRAAGHTQEAETTQYTIGTNILVCTDNHPVATVTGWKKACELNREDDIITASTTRRSSWCTKLPAATLRSLGLTEEITVGTRSQKTRRTNGTLVDLVGFFTGMCGSSIKGLFQMGLTSTTWMKTRPTTISTILSASNGVTTKQYINQPWLPTPTHQSNGNTSNVSDPSPRLGTPHRKENNGTASTVKSVAIQRLLKRGTQAWKKLAGYAQSVVLGLLASTENTSCVLTHVQYAGTKQKNGQKSWLRHVLALGVRVCSALCTAYRNSALPVARLRQTEPTGKQAVYNLSVEEAHCYYANGVLVHNCDCVIMALTRYRQGGFIRLATDEPEEPFYSRRRRGGYY